MAKQVSQESGQQPSAQCAPQDTLENLMHCLVTATSAVTARTETCLRYRALKTTIEKLATSATFDAAELARFPTLTAELAATADSPEEQVIIETQKLPMEELIKLDPLFSLLANSLSYRVLDSWEQVLEIAKRATPFVVSYRSRLQSLQLIKHPDPDEQDANDDEAVD